MEEKYETIIFRVQNNIAEIKFNRPEVYNAFNKTMNHEVIQALKKAQKDAEVRCIVITGEGKAFCAGQDLVDVDENTNHAEFLRTRYHPMILKMKETTKPIIAAINGTAAGAGMSIALGADFRLMQPEGKLISAFMEIGLIPDSGFLYTLPRLIGYAKALEIAVFGKPMTGKEAYQIGLVTELIDSSEWEEKVNEFACTVAALPTKSFSLIKRYMMDGMHEPLSKVLEQEAQAQRTAGKSNDHQEGVQAFKEKRQPKFTGS